MMTHLFDEIETAGKWVGMLTLLCLLIVPIGISCLLALVLSGDYADNLLQVVSYFTVVDPVACFVVACWNLSCSNKEASIEELQLPSFGMDEALNLWIPVIFMLCQSVLYVAMGIVIDNFIQQKYRKRGGIDGGLPPQLDVHEDVTQHAQEVKAIGNSMKMGDTDLQIKVVDICKTYPRAEVQAVCKNTFGVAKGEVFGLLGPNGAGKSTTFSMIAMQIPLTSGNAHVLGHEIANYPLT